MDITIKETKEIPRDQVLDIYRRNQWSAAEKPDLLYKGLTHSHTLISAWVGERLVGLANAVTDGYLVVYYPHMVVHPDYQGMGIGRKIMDAMHEKFDGFHQQILTADGDAVGFYERCGFESAGKTKPMWIYAGNDH